MHIVLPKSDRLKAVNCSINSNLYFFNAVDNNIVDSNHSIDITYTSKFADTFVDKAVDVIADIPPRISLGVENGVTSGDDLYVILTARAPKNSDGGLFNLYAGIRQSTIQSYAAFAHSDSNSPEYDEWFCILKTTAVPFTISIAVDHGNAYAGIVSLSSLGVYSTASWKRMQEAALLQMYQRHVNDTDDPEIRYVDSSLQREITHVADPTRGDSAATKSYVDALTSDVYTKSQVDTKVNAKANTSDMNSALAAKANISDMTDKLAAKANTSDMTKALATKANTSDFGDVYRIYSSLTALQATNGVDGQSATVTNDPVTANNGEYVYKSGVWVSVTQPWIDIGYGSSFQAQTFGNPPQLRKVNGIVFARGTSLKKSGSIVGNDIPFGVVPEQYRPKIVAYGTCNGASEHTVNLQCNTDGTINVKGDPTSSYVALDGMWWATD